MMKSVFGDSFVVGECLLLGESIEWEAERELSCALSIVCCVCMLVSSLFIYGVCRFIVASYQSIKTWSIHPSSSACLAYLLLFILLLYLPAYLSIQYSTNVCTVSSTYIKTFFCSGSLPSLPLSAKAKPFPSFLPSSRFLHR